MTDNTGEGISVESVRFYGQNSMDRIADNGTARIGVGIFGTAGRDRIGYIDLVFNSANRASSTAKLYAFMKDECYDLSISPNYGNYNPACNSPSVGGLHGGHVVANPTNKNLIQFMDYRACASLFGPENLYANGEHVADLSRPNTTIVPGSNIWNLHDLFTVAGGTVYYEEDDGSEASCHTLWSSDGTWLYSAFIRVNSTKPWGFRRFRWDAGNFVNQLLYTPRSPWSGFNTDVTRDQKWAALSTVFNTGETPILPVPAGYQACWVTLLDISNVNNVQAVDLCEVSLPTLAMPFAWPFANFSHSGRFVSLQAKTVVPGTTTDITSIAVIPRNSSLALPVRDIGPAINQLMDID